MQEKNKIRNKTAFITLPENLYWRAMKYAAFRQVKGGFSGVVREALREFVEGENEKEE